MNARKVLADNLAALMRRPDRPVITERELSERARARGYVVSPSSVNRILNCKVAPTLDHVVILAMLFGLEPWQLLTPGLNPDDPPVLVAISDRLRDFQAALKTQSDTIAALQNALKSRR
jgi:hypothetical protein